MTFFTSWQTWEKLCFILGCAICAVFVYAFGVRLMSYRKIKKHTRIAAEAQAERGEMTKTVEQEDQVSFGIRAIERGCAVEGVWNSKATTPLQTPPSSKPSSPALKGKNTSKKGKRDSSSSNISRLDIAEPALVTSYSREPGVGMPSGSLENSGTTDRTQVAMDSSPVAFELQTRNRTAHRIPESRSDRRSVPTALTYPSTSVRGSRPLPSRTSVDSHTDVLYPNDSVSQVSTVPRRPSLAKCRNNETDTELLPPKPKTRNLSQNLETLEYMNAHRQIHAAETGQLGPRIHRKGVSGDFTTGLPPSRSETSQDFVSARSVSWPTATSDCKQDETNVAAASSTDPDAKVDLVRAFVENHPLPTPRYLPLRDNSGPAQTRIQNPSDQAVLAPVANTRVPRDPVANNQTAPSKPSPPSAWTNKVQEQLEEKASEEKTVKKPLADVPLSHHNKMTRRINPGFEVLPVGTLTSPNPVKEWGDEPVGMAPIGNESRIPRKLRKRDRSGSRSRRSSSEHERSGQENVH